MHSAITFNGEWMFVVCHIVFATQGKRARRGRRGRDERMNDSEEQRTQGTRLDDVPSLPSLPEGALVKDSTKDTPLVIFP